MEEYRRAQSRAGASRCCWKYGSPMTRRLAITALIAAQSVPANFGGEPTLQLTEVELRRSAIQSVDPEYPAVARQIRLTGEVELEIAVDVAGAVEKATLLKGNSLLAGTSLQAIRKWRFNPFRASGQPARATGIIKFNFQI